MNQRALSFSEGGVYESLLSSDSFSLIRGEQSGASFGSTEEIMSTICPQVGSGWLDPAKPLILRNY